MECLLRTSCARSLAAPADKADRQALEDQAPGVPALVIGDPAVIGPDVLTRVVRREDRTSSSD